MLNTRFETIYIVIISIDVLQDYSNYTYHNITTIYKRVRIRAQVRTDEYQHSSTKVANSRVLYTYNQYNHDKYPLSGNAVVRWGWAGNKLSRAKRTRTRGAGHNVRPKGAEVYKVHTY